MSDTTEEATTPRNPPPPVRVSLTELETVESEVDHVHCLVCYSDLTHPGILPCGHNEICGVCHLRLRHLHGNRKCPICKEEHDQIISDVPGKTFEEYPIWGDDLGSNYVLRNNVGMFFPKDYYAAEVEPLFGHQCTETSCPYDGKTPDPEPEEPAENNGEGNSNNNQKNKKKNKKNATPLKSLQEHLRIKHRLTLCQLCVDNKRDFVARLPRMAPYQLKKHLTKGDGPGSGFEGHPVCEFCRPKRFYDLTALHMHLQKDHYKCHVCEKQGLSNQFFRNYKSLEKHFDKGHFLCQDPQCLSARFVVFENEIDLDVHTRQVHGGSTVPGSSKIQLEFRTRRAGYDGAGQEQQRQEVPSEDDFNFGLQGEAFVPAAMPQSNDITLHPMHLRRTAELRAQANEIRERQQVENEAASFPTLQAATAGTDAEAGAGQQHLSIGWASGTSVVTRVAGGKKKNAGQVTESDFPALPSAPAKSSASAKLRAGPQNRQFAAMRATASQKPVPVGGGWGGGGSTTQAAPASSYQYDGSAFPATMAPPANRQENLAPDNFPSLGGGTKRNPKFTSGLAAKKAPHQRQPPPQWNSVGDFPAPPSASAAPRARAMAPTAVAPAPKKPPSLNSQMDFPAPPSASKKNNKFTSGLNKKPQKPSQWSSGGGLPVASAAPPPRAMAPAPAATAPAPQKKAPSLNSQMDFPAPPGGKATKQPANPQDMLQDLQTSLGQAKYKKLKKFTKDFVQGNLTPEAYIDNAAGLFDTGFNDPGFWKLFPALVSSCPNESAAREALRYMESHRSRGAPAAGSFPAPARAVVAAPTKPATRYVTPQTGKKKNGWGGAAVAQPKKTPVSAASAAASQGQGGSATKYMAQQNKQLVQQAFSQGQGGKKKNKKKEKDELRKLAFGR